MFRKIRIALAAIFIVGITLLFVGIGDQWWGWMAKLQFLPSCLALNAAVIVGILLLTFVFGRIYCSVLCPLGVFQDVILWLRRTCGKIGNDARVRHLKSLKDRGVKPANVKKSPLKHFAYTKEHKWVRYPVLILSAISIIASGQMLIAFIAPYSAYGRMVHSIVGLSEGRNIGLPLLITAAVTFVVIVISAWIWGRGYCNTICPVGTTLSLVSRFSLFRPTIDASKCVSCGICHHNCKASCIDGTNRIIDYSRCVDCFDCIDNCSSGAIKYRFVGLKPTRLSKTGGGGENKNAVPASGNAGAKEKVAAAEAGENGPDKGRRSFIATSLALVGTGIVAGGQNKRLDGGLAEVLDKKSPIRSERPVPFGAKSVDSFYSRCTACQLCVSACPNEVLRPSTDLEHLLQPQMGYEHGYCRPECTACSQVCPSGAILPITREEKHTIRIGTAKVNFDLCLAAKGEAGCGNCVRHCPSGAIRMVFSDKLGHRVPVVNEEQCIGCGACEFLCPARPISAITVNGLSVHHSKV